MKDQSITNKAVDNEPDFSRTIKLYISRWKWFALSVLAFLIMAFLYLRYTTREYASNSLIRLISLSNNPTPEEAILGELGLVYGGDKLHLDETKILKSRSLMQEVVDELDLNIKVYEEGNIKNSQLYNRSPININYRHHDSLADYIYEYFEVSLISDTEFRFTDEYGVTSKKGFGESIFTSYGEIMLLPSDNFNLKKYRETKLMVVITPISVVASNYRNKLMVQSFNDRENRSNMIMISITDPIAQRAADLINKLVEIYNQRSIDSKMELAESTFNFINERIARISIDLNNIDIEKEDFKVGNTLTDVAAESGLYMQAEVGAQTELIRIATKLSNVNYMIDQLENSQDETGAYEVVPINIGLDDMSISSITSEYNKMVFERRRILKTSGERNPIVVQIDERLDGLMTSLRQSLRNLRSTLLIQQRNIEGQLSSINTQIADMPGQERKSRDIERQQKTKESIYLYLLQKREEANIAMSTAYPNAEIIDRAVPNPDVVVFPKKNIVYVAAFIFGLLFPLAIFLPKDMLDNSVQSKKDLLRIVTPQLKLMGEIITLKNPEDSPVLFESVRILRSNLDFELSKPEGKIIYVTSSILGEGKTFIAYHLAKAYKAANKKVLLLGADIRKPALHEYTKVIPGEGMSDFLEGSISLQDAIYHFAEDDSPDIMYPGESNIKPDLLFTYDRLHGLFSELKELYDIIIVDTAPTMLVNDTMLMAEHAEQTVFVVRAGYTGKELLDNISELSVEDKLKNLALVLNDIKPENMSFTNRYTYAYHQDFPRPWYVQVKNDILKRFSV
ncbi:hypothetical protein E7Z59_13580 [Robertkochia marina]|uniref:Polysaccharide biosynthesis tyrosine autokinase n=1 Tax=Robertkochia marina TaxID=1227945 RepID=A0A4V3UY07_9FLAO|nr:GNVR domain-containing protein [Robertkochia marina]THD66804.1 hypothetical protein E7Z59_13580 [Robertkochia marina]TRZ41905.1 hypothetical protein D3A96_12500 [Robertkochia marina]